MSVTRSLLWRALAASLYLASTAVVVLVLPALVPFFSEPALALVLVLGLATLSSASERRRVFSGARRLAMEEAVRTSPVAAHS